MKNAKIATIITLSALSASCAYKPITNSVTLPVSRNYASSWANNEVSAYIYGTRTVLEFKNDPSIVIVKDANNQSVNYEKIGQHYRLERRLDSFTVWYDTRPVTFTALEGTRTRVFSADTNKTAIAPLSGVEKHEPAKLTTIEQSQTDQAADIVALLELSSRQLADIRQTIKAIGNKQKRPVSRWLSVVDDRYINEQSATLLVNFEPFSTEFNPSPDLASILLSSAKAAQYINLRGYTDSRKAGTLDPKIAIGRAWSAREYLVNNGVMADKIEVFSQADGNFIAPSNAKKGRGLNRRVEIEIVDPRIEAIKKPLYSK